MNRYSENNNNKKDMFAFTLKKQNCQFSKRKKKKQLKEIILKFPIAVSMKQLASMGINLPQDSTEEKKVISLELQINSSTSDFNL